MLSCFCCKHPVMLPRLHVGGHCTQPPIARRPPHVAAFGQLGVQPQVRGQTNATEPCAHMSQPSASCTWHCNLVVQPQVRGQTNATGCALTCRSPRPAAWQSRGCPSPPRGATCSQAGAGQAAAVGESLHQQYPPVTSRPAHFLCLHHILRQQDLPVLRCALTRPPRGVAQQAHRTFSSSRIWPSCRPAICAFTASPTQSGASATSWPSSSAHGGEEGAGGVCGRSDSSGRPQTQQQW